ncbi:MULTISPECIES: histidinol-phosphate transaminase [unclassified Luteimonas]|uniref:histidinol-phosphate transaminase n=1 Tax=unclassified Luteimonas TaxID=2629088 RepID=UPI00160FB173|nr:MULTISPECIES: histidinol-phosphate transaminase [unclassified Luteimonas]MBB6599213.1 histidinol-phosphate transaminase [Luteimonas sp. MC1825]
MAHDDAAWAQARAVAPVRALRAYDPGHDIVALRGAFAPGVLLELGSNENPYGPGPRARAAAGAALRDIQRYPDPLAGGLRRALAAHHGVEPAQLVMGNGSHELLMQLAQVFAGPGDEVLVPEYGFAVFAIAAHAAGATLRRAPSFAVDAVMPRGHDLVALRAAVTPATRLVYIDNPNNPTGTWFGAAAFARFMDAVPDDVVVVLDEAYAELADAADFASALALLPRHRNLVITRTFSKAHGLAGLRIGYAIANVAVAALLERVRESFNVGLVAQAAATAALADQAWLADTSRRNSEERGRLGTALRARGFAVAPSQANFLLVDTGAATARIEAALLASGIVLRPMAGYGLSGSLRITVGTAADNARLLQALDALP